MTLKIFNKQEKPLEEKKLEVTVTEASTIEDLLSLFEQSIPSTTDSWKKDFEDYKKYLQGYQITPDLVSKVNLALPNQKDIGSYGGYKGAFLSALIQTSYDQGFNSFEFKEVSAPYFGSYFVGEPNKPITIKVEKLNGDWAFYDAENFVAEIQQLNGVDGFWEAKKFIAEIGGYKRDDFGSFMCNGKIYSPNSEVLETLKEQASDQQGIEFVLGKIPAGLLK